MQNRVLRGSQITVFKRSALKLAVVAAFVLGGVTSALAGTIGGNVTPINTLVQNDVSTITIGSTTAGASNGQTDTVIVTGTIDNNNEAGWKLTVASTNVGKLKRGSGGAGREILYTNVKLVTTGGTLGAGLVPPIGSKNLVTGAGAGTVAVPGTAIFNTGTAVGTVGTATTATVAYAYALQISWASDLTLLAGSYTDTITLNLANDI